MVKNPQAGFEETLGKHSGVRKDPGNRSQTYGNTNVKLDKNENPLLRHRPRTLRQRTPTFPHGHRIKPLGPGGSAERLWACAPATRLPRFRPLWRSAMASGSRAGGSPSLRRSAAVSERVVPAGGRAWAAPRKMAAADGKVTRAAAWTPVGTPGAHLGTLRKLLELESQNLEGQEKGRVTSPTLKTL